MSIQSHTWIVVKDTPEVVIIILAEAESDVGVVWGHSEDWLGVMLAEDGVVSTVTVVSVSSPGEMEVKLMSGGESKSPGAEIEDDAHCWFWASEGNIDTLAFKSSLILGITSVSGVPSTEILRRDMESSEDNVLEDKACDPYPLKKQDSINCERLDVFGNLT